MTIANEPLARSVTKRYQNVIAAVKARLSLAFRRADDLAGERGESTITQSETRTNMYRLLA